MAAFDLEEWAQALYVGPDREAADFALEILDLIANDVAEPYGELVQGLEHAAGDNAKGGAEKALEWLSGEAETLEEIRDILDKANARASNPPDASQDVQALLDRITELEDELDEFHRPWVADLNFDL